MEHGTKAIQQKFIKIMRLLWFFPSRFLQGNQIRSVTKKSFSGLEALQHL